MSITEKSNDYWSSKIGTHYGGLYYYALNSNIEGLNNANVLGFASTIQSAVYCPFFDSNIVDLYKIPFDTDYFGSCGGDGNIFVYRIVGNQYYYDNELFSKNLFFNKPGISELNWKNESKLQMAPYTYYQLADYFNQPLDIEPQYLPNNGTAKIKVMYTISNKGSYNLYIDNYKKDIYGNVYGLINQNSLDIPVLSSAYSQFLATSKNSFATNITNSLDTNNLNKAQNKTNYQLNMLNGITSGLSNWKNVLGTLTAGINAGASYEMTNQQIDLSNEQIISNAMSQVKDLESSPRAITSMGGDALFSMSNSKFSVHLIKYGLSGDGYERLGAYFALYGYKQNKLMNVNYRNRYYYNYIKTLDCNITTNIPSNYLQKLKAIFNKGVTIWHMDRSGVTIFDYSKDNKEV